VVSIKLVPKLPLGTPLAGKAPTAPQTGLREFGERRSFLLPLRFPFGKEKTTIINIGIENEKNAY
jgi:hypothetical protein